MRHGVTAESTINLFFKSKFFIMGRVNYCAAFNSHLFQNTLKVCEHSLVFFLNLPFLFLILKCLCCAVFSRMISALLPENVCSVTLHFIGLLRNLKLGTDVCVSSPNNQRIHGNERKENPAS